MKQLFPAKTHGQATELRKPSVVIATAHPQAKSVFIIAHSRNQRKVDVRVRQELAAFVRFRYAKGMGDEWTSWVVPAYLHAVVGQHAGQADYLAAFYESGDQTCGIRLCTDPVKEENSMA